METITLKTTRNFIPLKIQRRFFEFKIAEYLHTVIEDCLEGKIDLSKIYEGIEDPQRVKNSLIENTPFLQKLQHAPYNREFISAYETYQDQIATFTELRSKRLGIFANIVKNIVIFGANPLGLGLIKTELMQLRSKIIDFYALSQLIQVRELALRTSPSEPHDKQHNENYYVQFNFNVTNPDSNGNKSTDPKTEQPAALEAKFNSPTTNSTQDSTPKSGDLVKNVADSTDPKIRPEFGPSYYGSRISEQTMEALEQMLKRHRRHDFSNLRRYTDSVLLIEFTLTTMQKIEPYFNSIGRNQGDMADLRAPLYGIKGDSLIRYKNNHSLVNNRKFKELYNNRKALEIAILFVYKNLGRDHLDTDLLNILFLKWEITTQR